MRVEYLVENIFRKVIVPLEGLLKRVCLRLVRLHLLDFTGEVSVRTQRMNLIPFYCLLVSFKAPSRSTVLT